MPLCFAFASRRHRGIAATLLSISALLLPAASGCGGGSDSSPATYQDASQPGWTVRSQPVTQPTRPWTFLVFLNAANDLEPYGDLNLNQMETVGSTNDVNIVVQVKRMGGKYNPSGGTWSDTRRYFIQKDADRTALHSTLISQNSSVDMGSAAALKDFVTWATKAYPAQHYALVLWSHGNGWRKRAAERAATRRLARGICYDDQTGNYIRVPQLADALSPLGHKWDILACDACLMQMAEVAYEVKDQAQLLVGSEELTPASGYPYDAILGDLIANPTWQGRDFAQDVSKQMAASYTQADQATQSVLDTSQIDGLTAAVDNLGMVLAAKETDPRLRGQIALARSRSQEFDSGAEDNHDLYDFARLLAQPSPGDATYGSALSLDPDVQSAADQVIRSVRSAVVSANNVSSYSHAYGLAVFLPNAADYQTIEGEQTLYGGPTYPTLAFSHAAPHWAQFLTSAP